MTRIKTGEIQSMLGGEMEGVVLKHHDYDSSGKKVSTKLKYVTPKFKERHGAKQPQKEKSTPDEFLYYLGSQFCTPARFHKANQHLREKSILTGNFESDKLLLIEELDKDFTEEHTDLIKNYLWAEFSPTLKTFLREKLSAWYRLQLGGKIITNIPANGTASTNTPTDETIITNTPTNMAIDRTTPPINETALPTEEITIALPQEQSLNDFLREKASETATNELFSQIAENLKSKHKLINQMGVDMPRLIGELNSIFEADISMKEKLKQQLWMHLSRKVIEAARTGFEEWYAQHYE